MSLATQIKTELDRVEADAAAKWASFEQLRTDAKTEGVDLAKNEDAYKKLDEAHRAYSVVADEVPRLREKMFRALEMDGEKVDRPDPTDGTPRGEVKGDVSPFDVSLGDVLVKSNEYEELVRSGKLSSSAQLGTILPNVKAAERAEFKALITGLSRTSGGSFVTNDRQPGFVEQLFRPVVVRNLVTVGDTDSDTVEWVLEGAFTNAAAETAEATATTGASGTKPESGLAFSIVQSTVRNIAHWIPATRRALADAGQLRTLIDQRLSDGLGIRLDGQMVSGDGSGENLRGILNTSGIASVARGANPHVEALLSAITTIRLTFLDPSAIMLHPTDYQTMRLAKNANGDYYFGPPNLPGIMQAWGVPIVTSAVVPQGTGIVGKWNEAILWLREGVNIMSTDSHSDFFIRNMVVVLAETRAAFGVPRPAAFAQVTGL